MPKSNHIHTRYLLQEEYVHWDELVKKSKDGTIFHECYWLETWAAWQNLKFKIAGCYIGNELVGGMAFTYKRKFGLLKVMQIPYKTSYFGPVISDTGALYKSKIESHRKSIIQALTGFVLSEIGMLSASLSPAFNDIRPFIWKGFQNEVHYTYIADLMQEEGLTSMFDPSIRRQIKKAEKLDYQFLIDNSREYVLQAYSLEQKSFERQDLNLIYSDETSFIGFIADLTERGEAQTYTIQHNNGAAALIIVMDQAKKMAYYWLSGADSSILPTGLNQLLLELTLKDLREKGIQSFDFVGAGTESIARYKSAFNAPLVTFYRVEKLHGLVKFGMQIKNMLNPKK